MPQMKLLLRIFLSLSFLLVHGLGSTPVAAKQLVVNKKVFEFKAHSKGVTIDYTEANDVPTIHEGEVEDTDTDFVEDTEVEDENDSISGFRKCGGSLNYFSDYYSLSTALALSQQKASYFDDTRHCQISNDRYILFRVFRL